MSVSRSFRMSCECGNEFEAKLWDSVNVTEREELKSKLINGEINQIRCKKCKKRSYVEKHLLYHDMDKRLWVQMFPKADRPRWQELEAEHEQTLKKNNQIRRYQFRLAFGQDELLEKIRIFDSDLDDRILELLKLKMLEQDEALKEYPNAILTFSQYQPTAGEIHFKMVSHEKNVTQVLVVSYEAYEELSESLEHEQTHKEEYDELCGGLYVSVRKTRVFH